MAETPSTETMVKRLEGLLGCPRDIRPHEEGFILSLRHARLEQRLGKLSQKQVDWMLELHNRHFSG